MSPRFMQGLNAIIKGYYTTYTDICPHCHSTSVETIGHRTECDTEEPLNNASHTIKFLCTDCNKEFVEEFLYLPVIQKIRLPKKGEIFVDE